MANYKNFQIDSWEETDEVPTLITGDLHLWCLEIADIAVAAPASFASCSQEERSYAASINNPRLGLRFLYTHAMRRHILSGYLGVAPELLRFQGGQHGKPSLVWPQSPLQFNLSHSGTLCLLAVIWNTEIGIDVEQLRARPSIVAIAHRMFAPTVAAELVTLPIELQIQQFYYHWTRLEATIKACGSSLFAISPNKLQPTQISFIPTVGFQACIATYDILPPVNAWHTLKLMRKL